MPQHSQLNLPPTELEDLRSPVRSAANSLQRWRALVTRARERTGLSQKAMASEMGIAEQQLSDQLKGRENCHLSFWRMHTLPPEFWRELILLIVEFHDLSIGASARDQEDAHLGRAIRDVVSRCR